MAVALKARLDSKALAQAVLRMKDPVAKACASAVTTAGLSGKNRGRGEIAANTKGNKLKGSWAVRFYPGGGKQRPSQDSVNSAAYFYDKVEIVYVLEKGATIRGKPYLWIPLPGTPRRVGRGNTDPKRLRERGVNLFSFKSKKGTPLLGARTTKAGAARGSVSLGQLRNSGRYSVPLFFGMRSVTIKKRLNLLGIVRDEAEKLPQYYEAALRVD